MIRCGFSMNKPPAIPFAVSFLCLPYKFHRLLCAYMLYVDPAACFQSKLQIPFNHHYLSLPVGSPQIEVFGNIAFIYSGYPDIFRSLFMEA